MLKDSKTGIAPDITMDDMTELDPSMEKTLNQI